MFGDQIRPLLLTKMPLSACKIYMLTTVLQKNGSHSIPRCCDLFTYGQSNYKTCSHFSSVHVDTRIGGSYSHTGRVYRQVTLDYIWGVDTTHPVNAGHTYLIAPPLSGV